MAFKKMAVIFGNEERYSWTESYHFSDALALDAEQAALNSFVQLRAKMLPTDCFIIRIRLQGGVPRYPRVYVYENIPYAHGTFAGKINSSDDALLIRLQSSQGAYNRVFMRGLPDSLVTGEQFLVDDPAWLAVYNPWKAYLEASPNFAIVSNFNNIQPPILGGVLLKRAPKGILAEMPVGTTLAEGSQVRISGASVPGYNGTHNVQYDLGLVGATVNFVLGAGKMIIDNPDTDAVVVHPLDADVAVSFRVSMERFTLRKPGRPFGVRRGRARTLNSQRP